jgi:hypothetical protein
MGEAGFRAAEARVGDDAAVLGEDAELALSFKGSLPSARVCDGRPTPRQVPSRACVGNPSTSTYASAS